MKAVILAGGLGTRISEETTLKPKPMVEIGGKPILWHIMKLYRRHGIKEFIVCAGYQGHMITRYFHDYFINHSDVAFDLGSNSYEILASTDEDFKVTVIHTGLDTLTGGRLARIRKYVSDGPFCMTYGDGVSDVDITALVRFHKSHGKLATLTAVRPPGRFGIVTIDDTQSCMVQSFNEKIEGESSFINGGFFVLEPGALDYIKDADQTTWEQAPMTQLAADGQLAAFLHLGFWQPMDTLRDKHYLEGLWKSGDAPWKTWEG
jgi:glucose-1-phosphate cytidylyltransferase